MLFIVFVIFLILWGYQRRVSPPTTSPFVKKAPLCLAVGFMLVAFIVAIAAALIVFVSAVAFLVAFGDLEDFAVMLDASPVLASSLPLPPAPQLASSSSSRASLSLPPASLSLLPRSSLMRRNLADIKENSIPFPRLAPSPPASTPPPVLSSSPPPSLVLHAPRYQSDEFLESDYDIGHLPFAPLPRFAQQDLPLFPDLSEVPYNPVVGNVHSSALGLSGMTGPNHLQTDLRARRAPPLFEHAGPSNFVDPSAHADENSSPQCSLEGSSDTGIWQLEKALDELSSVLAPAEPSSSDRSVSWQAKARRERWRRPKSIEVWA
ncbi:hypothetical protein IWW39_005909 [Coemansia spiralis]|uniref:Uncharacterized protein n=1 Tax=Coemansia spiralis TaxID=417178 RepID=A0A9W8G954_9FUNG|nr:hypothetical protein IWW39_005909 [Coemansia spiralis]